MDVTLLMKQLDEGEEILWSGKAEKTEIFDKTNKAAYIRRTVISLGIMILLMVLCFLKVEDAGIGSYTIILIAGIVAPILAYKDARTCQSLEYYVTDRRLVRVNGGVTIMCPFNLIKTYRFRDDEDGNTTLLVGEKAIKSKPASWRSKVTFNSFTTDSKGFAEDYLFYAVDDVKGLSAVLEKQLGHKKAA